MVYVTTKIVRAEPCNLEGQDGYRVYYPDGYISWCPKFEFERTSRPIGMLEAVLIKKEWPGECN